MYKKGHPSCLNNVYRSNRRNINYCEHLPSDKRQTTSHAYGIGYHVSIKEPLILVAAELFDAKEFKEEWEFDYFWVETKKILSELKTLENYTYDFLKKMNYLHFLHIFKEFFLLHWERTTTRLCRIWNLLLYFCTDDHFSRIAQELQKYFTCKEKEHFQEISFYE